LTAQTSSSYNAATFRSRGIFFRQEYSNTSSYMHTQKRQLKYQTGRLDDV